MHNDEDFRLELELPVDRETLYAQFATEAGIRNWWTEACSMDERVGGKARFDFPGAGFFAEVAIRQLDPPRVVAWEVTDSRHPESQGWQNLRDWIGTELRFEIEEAPEGTTRLHFTHKGLLPLECGETCSNTWSHFLAGSLRQFLETGQGMPQPKSAG